MPRKKSLTKDQELLIIQYRIAGLKPSVICEKIGCSKDIEYRTWNLYNKTKN